MEMLEGGGLLDCDTEFIRISEGLDRETEFPGLEQVSGEGDSEV